jgi:two-component system response regulator YesN
LELLSGRKFKAEELANKLSVLRLPLSPNKPVCMVVIRLEDFDQYNRDDISLIEYAVSNMAEEIYGEEFHLWYAKEEHDYWVFLVQTKSDVGVNGESGGCSANSAAGVDSGDGARAANGTNDTETTIPSSDTILADNVAGVDASTPATDMIDAAALLEKIERKTSMLQYYVKLYLKGTISAMISDLGRFPEEIAAMYDTLIVQFLQHIGNDRELIILSTGHVQDRGVARHLSQLYEPPLLMHLLEAGRWEAVREKLSVVFTELEEHWGESHEHILEVYYAIVSSISYAVHKKKQWIAELLPDEYDRFTACVHFHTIAQLRAWTTRIIDVLEQVARADQQDNRKDVIRQVQQYVTDNLKHANLQEIAAHVYLNPSYLSKIYKLETGEGISEFIYRLRMEQAAHLLRTTNLKVYEVAEQLGYQKTSYFIKLFKDKYQCTPQEYKDMVSRI